MDIDARMNDISNALKELKNYTDIEGFVTDLEYHVGQLSYFYDELTPKQTGDPSTTFYRPKHIPKVHQIA